MSNTLHPETLLAATLVRDRYHRIKHLDRYFEGRTVLDIGSGTGFFSRWMAESAQTVFAIDLCLNNVKIGSTLDPPSNVRFINADSHHLPFASSSIDVVFFSCVLEHFEHPESFYNEIHRILKPDGRIIQSVDIRPAVTNWLYRLTFLFDRFYSTDHAMVHKKTVISDERDTEFINPEKLKSLLRPRFHILEEEKYAGLNFNVIHVSLVLINKCHQWLTGTIVSEDNYGEQIKNLDRFIFRVYRCFLPLIRFLVHPRFLTFDAIYYFLCLEKIDHEHPAS